MAKPRPLPFQPGTPKRRWRRMIVISIPASYQFSGGVFAPVRQFKRFSFWVGVWIAGVPANNVLTDTAGYRQTGVAGYAGSRPGLGCGLCDLMPFCSGMHAPTGRVGFHECPEGCGFRGEESTVRCSVQPGGEERRKADPGTISSVYGGVSAQ